MELKNRFKRSLLQTVALLVLGAALGAGLNAATESPLPWMRAPLTSEDERWNIVNAELVLEHLRNGTAIIIDARRPERYQDGHIEGALNVPQATFDVSFMELRDFLPREMLYVVYCDGEACNESIHVLIQMHELGFEDLALYPDGWQDWVDQDYPIGAGS